MASSTSSTPCWSSQVYEAFDMLSSGNNQGAISALQTLRRDSRLPRFWRIQTLALLANAVEDWYEAESYQQAAEMLYKATRTMFPPGCDDGMDAALYRNRLLLDQLAVELDNTMPDDIRALREQVEEEDESETDEEDNGDSEDDDDDDIHDPDDGHEEV